MYLEKSKIYESIKDNVFVLGDDKIDLFESNNNHTKMKFNFIKNTSDNALVNKIFRKYAGKNIDTVKSKLDVKENLGFINIF